MHRVLVSSHQLLIKKITLKLPTGQFDTLHCIKLTKTNNKQWVSTAQFYPFNLCVAPYSAFLDIFSARKCWVHSGTSREKREWSAPIVSPSVLLNEWTFIKYYWSMELLKVYCNKKPNIFHHISHSLLHSVRERTIRISCPEPGLRFLLHSSALRVPTLPEHLHLELYWSRTPPSCTMLLYNTQLLPEPRVMYLQHVKRKPMSQTL